MVNLIAIGNSIPDSPDRLTGVDLRKIRKEGRNERYEVCETLICIGLAILVCFLWYEWCKPSVKVQAGK